MRTVYFFEKTCCGPSQSEEVVNFLQKKFNGTAEVKTFDLGKSTGNIPMPPSLLFKIQSEGIKCLPVMVVDGNIVVEGGIPNLMDAVRLVETGKPSVKELNLIQQNNCCS
ncbi:arsenic metallochaperone ArsD family protein [Niallia sp. Krafla_26]|uniref:arsenic metallochaperone ArsD family protein n=1 Tax=Niallia sp. Krafla_26 TaxID=3064703 RepID=UPI003D184E30